MPLHSFPLHQKRLRPPFKLSETTPPQMEDSGTDIRWLRATPPSVLCPQFLVLARHQPCNGFYNAGVQDLAAFQRVMPLQCGQRGRPEHRKTRTLEQTQKEAQSDEEHACQYDACDRSSPAEVRGSDRRNEQPGRLVPWLSLPGQVPPYVV
jgi:hypothetical protein